MRRAGAGRRGTLAAAGRHAARSAATWAAVPEANKLSYERSAFSSLVHDSERWRVSAGVHHGRYSPGAVAVTAQTAEEVMQMPVRAWLCRRVAGGGADARDRRCHLQVTPLVKSHVRLGTALAKSSHARADVVRRQAYHVASVPLLDTASTALGTLHAHGCIWPEP